MPPRAAPCSRSVASHLNTEGSERVFRVTTVANLTLATWR